MDLQPLRETILRQRPHLSEETFTLLAEGFDVVAVDVDDRLIFKFPRHEAGARALRYQAQILDVIRPVISMAIPTMTLYERPRLFSCHAKIPGGHLLADDYAALASEARNALARAMAAFFASLHRLPAAEMEAAGARAIRTWCSPEDIIAHALPLLGSEALRARAQTAMAAWRQLPPDPHGCVFGFFDGHGWNMAFDHARQRLNGIYDFGDSGFGSLHQEFIYPGLISRDLVWRIADAYEALAGLSLDRDRIELLGTLLRLSELAEAAMTGDIDPRIVAALDRWWA